MNKTLIASIAAVGALAAALPAAAQSYGGRDATERLERRIERGIASGDLTRGEAGRLRAELADLRRLEWRFSRDGLSRFEARELDQRYASLESRIRFERRDYQQRGDRRGYGAGYGYR